MYVYTVNVKFSRRFDTLLIINCLDSVFILEISANIEYVHISTCLDSTWKVFVVCTNHERRDY